MEDLRGLTGMDGTPAFPSPERLRQEELEQRVAERTIQLTQANERLRNEVSERARTEAALRASEERFRIMGETIAAAAFIFQGSKLVEANSAAQRITGYTRSELVGKDFWMVIHPDHRELVVGRGLARQRGEAVPSSYEVKILRKDGGVRWVDFTAGVIDYQGQPAVLGTAYDITDRKLAEEALRESEERFRSIFEQAAVGIAHVSPDGQFLHVNQRLCNMLGYTKEELITKKFLDVTHPEHAQRDARHHQRMIEGELETYSTEKMYVRRDGTPLWTHLTVSVVRDPGGKAKYFVSVMENISQQKKAQEDLRQSEQRLQSILDYSPAVIYVKDPEGRYILVNRRYEELFHVTGDQIIGRTDLDVFGPEVAHRLRHNDKTVLESGGAIEFEEIVPHDNEPNTYISVKFPIKDHEGRTVLCGISTNITERKRGEEELRQAKELAELASSAKSRFLANISHEIRTPIMAMLGAAEIVRHGAVRLDQVREHGELILRNGRHLLALVDDLLDQSRMEAGRLHVQPGPCSLPELMTDVHAVTAPLQRPGGARLEFFYETPIPEGVTTDRTRLTQAIVNVVHNALKFTPQGHVHVRVRVEGVDPWLTVVVEDTGCGIAASDLESVFEPFTQVGTGSAGAAAGIGLGLPLARMIARRLGGDLQVLSELGAGSRFTLKVPVGPVEPGEWISPQEASQWWRISDGAAQPVEISLHGSVLVAEDADDVRRLITHALESAGAEVVAVPDGRAALDAAKYKSFDLVLLDIRMPEMDGLETMRALRSSGCRSALVALTASTTVGEYQRILAAGFDDLWAKPISLERLVDQASAYLPSRDAEPSTSPAGSREALIQEARDEFLGSLGPSMKKLQRAVEHGEFQEAGEVLHQLVGSAGIHGFIDLSQLADLAYGRLKARTLDCNSREWRDLEALMAEYARGASRA